MAWQQDTSRAGGIPNDLRFVIGIPGIGIDEPNVREGAMVIPQNVDINYDRHVLEELSSYTSVALLRPLTNGSARSSC